MKIKPNTNNENLTRKIIGIDEESKKKKLDVIEEKPLTLFLNDQERSLKLEILFLASSCP